MILPDPSQFTFKECTLAGDLCWLITPSDMKVVWTPENARFRSCIVRQSDHFICSQLYRRFPNLGEIPHFEPWDPSWEVKATRKIDGSLLGITYYEDNLMARTRGTVDARMLPNGYEIDALMLKYPKVFDNDVIRNGDYTVLTEWTTPTNIICIREHDEPTLTLLGIVANCDAQYVKNDIVDALAKEWDIARPEYYSYGSVAEAIADVELWEGKEGIVLYSPDFQVLKKIKAAQYLRLHLLATGVRNINQVLDVFLESPMFTEYGDFYDYIHTTMGYEIAEKIKDDCDRIIKAYNKYLDALALVLWHMDLIRKLEIRKEQAQEIMKKFKSWEVPAAFLLLDNREIEPKLIRKAIEQNL